MVIKDITPKCARYFELRLNEEELIAINHALYIFNTEHSNPYGHTSLLQILLAKTINKGQ